MHFDPVLFDNTMYATASDAVLFCTEYLEKNGHAQAAMSLQNLLPVTGHEMATFAREALIRVRAQLTDQTAESYVVIALHTLERAIAGDGATYAVAA